MLKASDVDHRVIQAKEKGKKFKGGDRLDHSHKHIFVSVSILKGLKEYVPSEQLSVHITLKLFSPFPACSLPAICCSL